MEPFITLYTVIICAFTVTSCVSKVCDYLKYKTDVAVAENNKTPPPYVINSQ